MRHTALALSSQQLPFLVAQRHPRAAPNRQAVILKPTVMLSLADHQPSTDEARQKECNWIRSEIARHQNIVTTASVLGGSPIQVTAIQVVARDNIAALQSRAANIQCSAAFSNNPVIS